MILWRKCNGDRNRGFTDTMNYKKEVQEVLTQIRFVKNRLAGITLNMDEEGRDPASLEEALEALDDAVDILADFAAEE